MIHKIFTFTIILLSIITTNFSNFLGPVKINVKRLEKCDEDLLGVKFEYFRHRINRTAFGTSTNLTLPFDLDDTITLNVSASIWGDGGWKPNAFDFQTDGLCTFLLVNLKYQIEQILDIFNLPHQCPVPSGFYGLKDFVYDGKTEKPFLYGEFMLDVKLIKDNVTFLCLRQIIETTPK